MLNMGFCVVVGFGWSASFDKLVTNQADRVFIFGSSLSKPKNPILSLSSPAFPSSPQTGCCFLNIPPRNRIKPSLFVEMDKNEFGSTKIRKKPVIVKKIGYI